MTLNVFSSFIVHKNRNRSAPVRELLSKIHCLSVSCMKINHLHNALVI